MHAAEPLNPAAKMNGGAAMAAMLANGGNSPQPSPNPKGPEQQLQGAGGPNAASLLPNSAKDNKNSATLIKKEGTSSGKGATSSSTDPERDGVRRTQDPKTLRRLAQNREAARKSRLRKKAYIQQLETSRIRLSQIEQQVQAARVQVIWKGKNTVQIFD
jgi:transcription factor TGA